MESEPLIKPQQQPSVPAGRPMRPQYHFLYGSTTSSGGGDDDGGKTTSTSEQQQTAGDDNSGRNSSITSHGGGGEQESLIGESLVPTDNEEEPPTASANDYDLQHVLISNGNTRHVVGVNNKNGNKGGAGIQHYNNNGHNGSNGNRNNNHHHHHHHNGLNGSNNDGHHPLGNVKNIHTSLVSWRDNHPALHVVGLVGCMIICMVIFAVTLFPSTASTAAKDAMGAASGTSSSSITVRKFVMKFPTVDRSKSNDPVRGFLNKELFHPDLIYQGTDNPFQEFTFPFPTGAFWTNLVLPPTADRGFSYPVAVYPYAYKWSDTLLSTSYPALHRKEEDKAIHDYFFPDLTFGSVEQVEKRQVTSFDPLSISLQFQTSSSGSKSNSIEGWQTYLVQGSPYVTIEYNNVTPQIKALSTFTNVFCPGEEGMNYDNGKYEGDFADDFSDDDDDSTNGRRRTRGRRKLLGVCGTSTDNDGKTVLRGVQFVLQSQEGVNWIIFSSEPTSFVFDSKIRTDVVSSKVFKGTIRLAIIPPSSKITESGNGMAQISSSTGLRRLVYHASVYPIGAKVDYSFRDPTATSTTTTKATKNVLDGLTAALTANRKTTAPTVSSVGRVASVNFHFVTKSANSDANAAAAATGKTTGLLMLSLPHQAFALTKSHILDYKHFDLVYQCIKGSMTPVVGSVWTYEEKLPSLGFDPLVGGPSTSPSYSPESVLSDKFVRKLLSDNIEDDLNIALPTRTENIYGFGKQVARLAQLAHIADKLAGPDGPPIDDNSSSNATSPNNSSSKSSSGGTNYDRILKLRQTAAEKLSSFLELLLTNQLSDSLLYDASLGGLVSTDGLADFNADFGNGRYNDHHFHYGYILYACAVMGKLNATFVENHGDKVDAIMHDVAHDTNLKDNSFFPLARHMSWFDGHSYASGLFPFGNGKSQESSSEAVNCYYGSYLWSLVRTGSADNPNADISPLTDFARLLLAMEIRGARTYWHMMPPKPATPSSSSSSSISSSSSSSSSSPVASSSSLSITNNGTSTTTLKTTTTIATTAPATPVVYSPHFAENYMVGNLGMMDAICSTWFGTENLYVHMINFIPVTSVTRLLFNKEYVIEEYANVISNYPEVEMAWRGYVICDQAIVDPKNAWIGALNLLSNQLDSGLSKTQVLYFILTSPDGFDLSQIISKNGGNDRSSTSGSLSNSSSGISGSSSSSSGSGSYNVKADCSIHKECVESGLEGLCCPTKAGSFLYCCN